MPYSLLHSFTTMSAYAGRADLFFASFVLPKCLNDPIECNRCPREQLIQRSQMLVVPEGLQHKEDCLLEVVFQVRREEARA